MANTLIDANNWCRNLSAFLVAVEPGQFAGPASVMSSKCVESRYLFMMFDARNSVAHEYLQHFSSTDLELLATAGHAVLKDAFARCGGSGRMTDLLRDHPDLLDELLASPEVADVVFEGGTGPQHGATESAAVTPRPDFLTPISPFLTFAVAIARTSVEISTASYITEWFGPRRRAPIFDVSELSAFLSSPARRLFLAELLGSYTHVSSGSIAVATRHGIRRQRFSELDPVRLADLLDLVADTERPGIYRRLGDLALFLTGVFPDHTALRTLGARNERRLLHSGRLRGRELVPRVSVPGFGDPGPVELFEHLGRRWYGLAYRLVPQPRPAALAVVGELSERFGQARRVLNVVTDRYLFPLRSEWFGISSA